MKATKRPIPTPPLNTARVIATKIEYEHLQPGDLWSDKGPEYWNGIMDKGFMSESVIMRTNAEYDVTSDDPATVYKLTIVITNSEIAAKQADVHTVSGDISPHSPPGMDYDEWVNKGR